MDFRDDADLDASQVGDAGRGGGIPGGGLTIGGGAVGIIGLILALVFGINPGDLGGGGGDGGGGGKPGQVADLSKDCKKGTDADQKPQCRVVGVVNSVQAYWSGKVDGSTKARTILFTESVQTGCGAATSEVGPFYCPTDKQVYLDLGFFDELQSRFGAKGGPFAQAYVIGHEYGHHVQHLLGTDRKVGNDREGADSGSVRLELQADCYAGVWANHADDDKNLFDAPFTKQDIEEAVSAAAAVGDDRIQSGSGGRVDPEKWTHGSAAQRVQWFSTGYDSGNPDQCDTFSAPLNG